MITRFQDFESQMGFKAIGDLFFRFELLEILSFDSVRRRMSVIVKSATGRNVFFLRVFELYVVVVLFSCLRSATALGSNRSFS